MERFYEGQIAQGKSESTASSRTGDLWIYADFLGHYYGRALDAGQVTRIGNRCLLMVGAHVAHDCTVGDSVILTNNVLLGGHVTVGDKAYLSGGVAVHQYCNIGTLAMVGGMARVTRDVPPFVMIDGGSTMVVGLNKVGLRRAGFNAEELRQLKAAYQVIYRSGLAWTEILDVLELEFPVGPAAALLRSATTPPTPRPPNCAAGPDPSRSACFRSARPRGCSGTSGAISSPT